MASSNGFKKGTVVELENATQGKRPFSVEEATNILSMPQNTGLWVLPAKSKYKFQDGKIIRSTGSPTATHPKE